MWEMATPTHMIMDLDSRVDSLSLTSHTSTFQTILAVANNCTTNCRAYRRLCDYSPLNSLTSACRVLTIVDNTSKCGDSAWFAFTDLGDIW